MLLVAKQHVVTKQLSGAEGKQFVVTGKLPGAEGSSL
jgi:hypothetical protein